MADIASLPLYSRNVDQFASVFWLSNIRNGVAWGGVVVKALRYWSDGPGIDSRWCHWGFFPWYPRQNHVP